jgi:CYTH domain-containing protein
MTARRRFLVPSAFARLIQREKGGLRFVEGFFSEQRDRSSWIRLEEGRGLLILRTVNPDGEAEHQTDIPVTHAHALLDVCAGEVEYTRTELPLHQGYALVDEIIHPAILHLVTVEFATERAARSFRPLQWFGPEVTAAPCYTTQSIALRGLEEALQVPLSDPALNSLIDTLEGRFPAPIPVTVPPPEAKQSPVTRAKAQSTGKATKVQLDEIEEAMMREMQQALQRAKPT